MGKLRKRRTHSDPRVVLVGLSYGGLDGQVLTGFHRYRRLHTSWHVYNAGHHREALDVALGAPVLGVLANVTDEQLARRLKRLRCPVIDLSNMVPRARLHHVGPDNVAAGRTAAEFFADRGYANLVFVSDQSREFELRRWEGFAASARDRGLRALWAQLWHGRLVDAQGSQAGPRRGKQPYDWLDDAPLPLGLYGASDSVALGVEHQCLLRDMHVPEQAAILGNDDFENVCQMADIPLSSVRPGGERIGDEAGRRLDAMVRGEPCGNWPCLLPPLGVRQRGTTGALAVADPMVAAAMRFIRDNAAGGINVADVARHCRANRRVFHRVFARVMGHAPLEAIYRARVELAKERLLNTDQKLHQIAEDCGFRDPDRLTRFFRRIVGVNPSAFRDSFRGGATPWWRTDGAGRPVRPSRRTCRTRRPARPP